MRRAHARSRRRIAVLALTLSAVAVIASALSPAAQAVTPKKGTALATKGGRPFDVAVNPITGSIYATNYSSDTVAVLHAKKPTVLIHVGTHPYGIAVDSTTDRIYVANQSTHGTVSVIDGATNKVLHTIGVGNTPYGIAVDPTTDRIYVANVRSNSVSVINGATAKIAITLSVGVGPIAVAVDASTDRAYVAETAADLIWVINGTTKLGSIKVGGYGYPWAITVDATSDTAYVGLTDGGLPGAGGVTAINLHTNKSQVVPSEQGLDVNGIAVNSVTKQIFVSSGSSETGAVTVFDTSQVDSAARLGYFKTAGDPEGITINRHTDTTYVANDLTTGSLLVYTG
jgi:YVTN family beta-propeller protein